MCGRFTLTKDEDVIEYRFSRKTSAKWDPSYNIAPTNSVAVISSSKPEQIALIKWGWISSEKNLIINARSETIFEKPLFKNAIIQQRCLIIADGYIEWRNTAHGKQPYYIQLPDKDIFAFAGIIRKNNINHSSNFECVIITTQANKTVNHIHHRMPFILQKKHESLWIDEELPYHDLNLLMSENVQPSLTSITLGFEINKVSNNYPELLQAKPKSLDLFD